MPIKNRNRDSAEQYTERKGNTPVAILLRACTVQIKCQCALGYDGVRAIHERQSGEWRVSGVASESDVPLRGAAFEYGKARDEDG